MTATGLNAEQVLVVGATGTVGRELLKELRLQGQHIRAASREPLAALQHIDAETDWVRFDYQSEETFAPALEGVQRVFMILPPGDNMADMPATVFIRRMCEMNVRGLTEATVAGDQRTRNDALRPRLLLGDTGGQREGTA